MGILLFNWFGYQILYSHLQSIADKKLEVQLDKDNYNENDLISIKLPLFSPYITDESSFQRIDGEINIDGIHYKFVKRKVFHDTLILLCLRNTEKMKLKDASNEYFKAMTDLQRENSGKSKSSDFAKSLLAEFEIKENKWQLYSLPNFINTHFLHATDHYSFTFMKSCERPPDSSLSLS
jgi:hypothetical protein